MNSRRFALASLATPALACLAIAFSFGASAPGDEQDSDRQPGFVDGSVFTRLAKEDKVKVEVSLKGPLLKLLSSAVASEDEEAAKLVAGLDSVYCLVVGLDEEAREKAAQTAHKMAEGLKKKGWEPLVRVREEGTDVTVLLNATDKAIHGLVVMVIDPNEGQLVFVNIVGTIELEKLERLSGKLDIPGLDEVFQKKAPADKKHKGSKAKPKSDREEVRAGRDDDAEGVR